MIDLNWRPPVLETARLRLRPYEDADADALFAIASNRNVTQFTLWDAHRTVTDTVTFLRDYVMANYRSGVADPYALELKETGELIGSIGARWATEENKCFDFGYWIAEPYWGRGLAVEAARAMIGYLFANYEVERIQAHCCVENSASARVLEKLGLTYEGTHRSALFHRDRFWDLRMYAVLRGEFNRQ